MQILLQDFLIHRRAYIDREYRYTRIPKETLMNKVSFVFQNSRLIKASVLENVRMAKPSATREEIAHALETAQCLDIIEKLQMEWIR